MSESNNDNHLYKEMLQFLYGKKKEAPQIGSFDAIVKVSVVGPCEEKIALIAALTGRNLSTETAVGLETYEIIKTNEGKKIKFIFFDYGGPDHGGVDHSAYTMNYASTPISLVLLLWDPNITAVPTLQPNYLFNQIQLLSPQSRVLIVATHKDAIQNGDKNLIDLEIIEKHRSFSQGNSTWQYLAKILSVSSKTGDGIDQLWKELMKESKILQEIFYLKNGALSKLHNPFQFLIIEWIQKLKSIKPIYRKEELEKDLRKHFKLSDEGPFSLLLENISKMGVIIIQGEYVFLDHFIFNCITTRFITVVADTKRILKGGIIDKKLLLNADFLRKCRMTEKELLYLLENYLEFAKGLGNEIIIPAEFLPANDAFEVAMTRTMFVRKFAFYISEGDQEKQIMKDLPPNLLCYFVIDELRTLNNVITLETEANVTRLDYNKSAHREYVLNYALEGTFFQVLLSVVNNQWIEMRITKYADKFKKATLIEKITSSLYAFCQQYHNLHMESYIPCKNCGVGSFNVNIVNKLSDLGDGRLLSCNSCGYENPIQPREHYIHSSELIFPEPQSDSGEWEKKRVRIGVIEKNISLGDYFVCLEKLKEKEDVNIEKYIGITFNNAVNILVKEYVHGINLREYLKKHTSPLPLSSIKNLLLQICSGMNFLHENGILHMNLLLENVMVEGDNIKVKLMNYGKKSFITNPSKFFAPEILQNIGYSKASDVWSFGIIMLALVSAPFASIDFMEMEEKKVEPFLVEIIGMCLDTYDKRPTFRQLSNFIENGKVNFNILEENNNNEKKDSKTKGILDRTEKLRPKIETKIVLRPIERYTLNEEREVKTLEEEIDKIFGKIFVLVNKSEKHRQAFYYIFEKAPYSLANMFQLKQCFKGSPNGDSKAFNRVLRCCGSDTELCADAFEMVKNWGELSKKRAMILNKYIF